MRFKTYLHPDSKFQLSDRIIKFENGIYETDDNEIIEELKKVSTVFIDEAVEDNLFKSELDTIKNLNNQDASENDVINEKSSQKKAGRPKKNV